MGYCDGAGLKGLEARNAGLLLESGGNGERVMLLDVLKDSLQYAMLRFAAPSAPR